VRPVGKPADFQAKVTREAPQALDGTATLKEIEITFSGPNGVSAERTGIEVAFSEFSGHPLLPQ
jgi:hypothetical protein